MKPPVKRIAPPDATKTFAVKPLIGPKKNITEAEPLIKGSVLPYVGPFGNAGLFKRMNEKQRRSKK
jgi:hypothetical protein